MEGVKRLVLPMFLKTRWLDLRAPIEPLGLTRMAISVREQLKLLALEEE